MNITAFLLQRHSNKGFYDPNQPENHTNKRELEKQSKRVGEKKTTHDNDNTIFCYFHIVDFRSQGQTHSQTFP